MSSAELSTAASNFLILSNGRWRADNGVHDPKAERVRVFDFQHDFILVQPSGGFRHIRKRSIPKPVVGWRTQQGPTVEDFMDYLMAKRQDEGAANKPLSTMTVQGTAAPADERTCNRSSSMPMKDVSTFAAPLRRMKRSETSTRQPTSHVGLSPGMSTSKHALCTARENSADTLQEALQPTMTRNRSQGLECYPHSGLTTANSAGLINTFGITIEGIMALHEEHKLRAAQRRAAEAQAEVFAGEDTEDKPMVYQSLVDGKRRASQFVARQQEEEKVALEGMHATARSFQQSGSQQLPDDVADEQPVDDQHAQPNRECITRTVGYAQLRDALSNIQMQLAQPAVVATEPLRVAPAMGIKRRDDHDEDGEGRDDQHGAMADDTMVGGALLSMLSGNGAAVERAGSVHTSPSTPSTPMAFEVPSGNIFSNWLFEGDRSGGRRCGPSFSGGGSSDVSSGGHSADGTEAGVPASNAQGSSPARMSLSLEESAKDSLEGLTAGQQVHDGAEQSLAQDSQVMNGAASTDGIALPAESTPPRLALDLGNTRSASLAAHNPLYGLPLTPTSARCVSVADGVLQSPRVQCRLFEHVPAWQGQAEQEPRWPSSSGESEAAAEQEAAAQTSVAVSSNEAMSTGEAFTSEPSTSFPQATEFSFSDGVGVVGASASVPVPLIVPVSSPAAFGICLSPVEGAAAAAAAATSATATIAAAAAASMAVGAAPAAVAAATAGSMAAAAMVATGAAAMTVAMIRSVSGSPSPRHMGTPLPSPRSSPRPSSMSEVAIGRLGPDVAQLAAGVPMAASGVPQRSSGERSQLFRRLTGELISAPAWGKDSWPQDRHQAGDWSLDQGQGGQGAGGDDRGPDAEYLAVWNAWDHAAATEAVSSSYLWSFGEEAPAVARVYEWRAPATPEVSPPEDLAGRASPEFRGLDLAVPNLLDRSEGKSLDLSTGLLTWQEVSHQEGSSKAGRVQRVLVKAEERGKGTLRVLGMELPVLPLGQVHVTKEHWLVDGEPAAVREVRRDDKGWRDRLSVPGQFILEQRGNGGEHAPSVRFLPADMSALQGFNPARLASKVEPLAAALKQWPKGLLVGQESGSPHLVAAHRLVKGFPAPPHAATFRLRGSSASFSGLKWNGCAEDGKLYDLSTGQLSANLELVPAVGLLPRAGPVAHRALVTGSRLLGEQHIQEVKYVTQWEFTVFGLPLMRAPPAGGLELATLGVVGGPSGVALAPQSELALGTGASELTRTVVQRVLSHAAKEAGLVPHASLAPPREGSAVRGAAAAVSTVWLASARDYVTCYTADLVSARLAQRLHLPDWPMRAGMRAYVRSLDSRPRAIKVFTAAAVRGIVARVALTMRLGPAVARLAAGLLPQAATAAFSGKRPLPGWATAELAAQLLLASPGPAGPVRFFTQYVVVPALIQVVAAGTKVTQAALKNVGKDASGAAISAIDRIHDALTSPGFLEAKEKAIDRAAWVAANATALSILLGIAGKVGTVLVLGAGTIGLTLDSSLPGAAARVRDGMSSVAGAVVSKGKAAGAAVMGMKALESREAVIDMAARCAAGAVTLSMLLAWLGPLGTTAVLALGTVGKAKAADITSAAKAVGSTTGSAAGHSWDTVKAVGNRTSSAAGQGLAKAKGWSALQSRDTAVQAAARAAAVATGLSVVCSSLGPLPGAALLGGLVYLGKSRPSAVAGWAARARKAAVAGIEATQKRSRALGLRAAKVVVPKSPENALDVALRYVAMAGVLGVSTRLVGPFGTLAAVAAPVYYRVRVQPADAAAPAAKVVDINGISNGSVDIEALSKPSEETVPDAPLKPAKEEAAATDNLPSPPSPVVVEEKPATPPPSPLDIVQSAPEVSPPPPPSTSVVDTPPSIATPAKATPPDVVLDLVSSKKGPATEAFGKEKASSTPVSKDSKEQDQDQGSTGLLEFELGSNLGTSLAVAETADSIAAATEPAAEQVVEEKQSPPTIVNNPVFVEEEPAVVETPAAAGEEVEVAEQEEDDDEEPTAAASTVTGAALAATSGSSKKKKKRSKKKGQAA